MVPYQAPPQALRSFWPTVIAQARHAMMESKPGQEVVQPSQPCQPLLCNLRQIRLLRSRAMQLAGGRDLPFNHGARRFGGNRWLSFQASLDMPPSPSVHQLVGPKGKGGV